MEDEVVFAALRIAVAKLHLSAGAGVGTGPSGDRVDRVAAVVERSLDDDLALGQDRGPGALEGVADDGADAAAVVVSDPLLIRRVEDRIRVAEHVPDRVLLGGGADVLQRVGGRVLDHVHGLRLIGGAVLAVPSPAAGEQGRGDEDGGKQAAAAHRWTCSEGSLRARSRSSSTIAGSAFAGEPASKGGSGSYSIPSWIACATSSPASSRTSSSAMSIPDATPAAVTYLPSTTTRRSAGSAPNAASVSRQIQWQVAALPSSRPAAARTSEPVQTDVVHLVVWSISRSHPSTSSSASRGRVPAPPGTSTISALSSSERATSTVRPSAAVSVRTSPCCLPTKATSAPGIRDSTS